MNTLVVSSHFEDAETVISAIGRENIIFSLSSFWMWNAGGFWERVEDRYIKQLVQETVVKDKITSSYVSSILEIIKSMVYRKDHKFDEKQKTINCKNGELLLEDGKWVLHDHCREHYRTSQIPVYYDADAQAPRFEKFLDEIFEYDEDKEDKKLLFAEMLGYCLIPSTEFEKFFILTGPGANGKSRLLRVIEELLGQNNVSSVDPKEFSNRFQVAYLQCKMANIITELSIGHKTSDGQLKAIASGELITAEYKHQPPFQFRPTCKVFCGTNHPPVFKDNSNGLYRRAVIISFNRVFQESEQDKKLDEKLANELPGILNIALRGLKKLLEDGYFIEPQSCKDAKLALQLRNDHVARFIFENCIKEPGLKVSISVLHDAYRKWSISQGIISLRNKNDFSRDVVNEGAEHCKGTGGERMIAGIALKP